MVPFSDHEDAPLFAADHNEDCTMSDQEVPLSIAGDNSVKANNPLPTQPLLLLEEPCTETEQKLSVPGYPSLYGPSAILVIPRRGFFGTPLPQSRDGSNTATIIRYRPSSFSVMVVLQFMIQVWSQWQQRPLVNVKPPQHTTASSSSTVLLQSQQQQQQQHQAIQFDDQTNHSRATRVTRHHGAVQPQPLAEPTHAMPKTVTQHDQATVQFQVQDDGDKKRQKKKKKSKKRKHKQKEPARCVEDELLTARLAHKRARQAQAQTQQALKHDKKPVSVTGTGVSHNITTTVTRPSSFSQQQHQMGTKASHGQQKISQPPDNHNRGTFLPSNHQEMQPLFGVQTSQGPTSQRPPDQEQQSFSSFATRVRKAHPTHEPLVAVQASKRHQVRAQHTTSANGPPASQARRWASFRSQTDTPLTGEEINSAPQACSGSHQVTQRKDAANGKRKLDPEPSHQGVSLGGLKGRAKSGGQVGQVHLRSIPAKGSAFHPSHPNGSNIPQSHQEKRQGPFDSEFTKLFSRKEPRGGPLEDIVPGTANRPALGTAPSSKITNFTGQSVQGNPGGLEEGSKDTVAGSTIKNRMHHQLSQSKLADSSCDRRPQHSMTVRPSAETEHEIPWVQGGVNHHNEIHSHAFENETTMPTSVLQQERSEIHVDLKASKQRGPISVAHSNDDMPSALLLHKEGYASLRKQLPAPYHSQQSDKCTEECDILPPQSALAQALTDTSYLEDKLPSQGIVTNQAETGFCNKVLANDQIANDQFESFAVTAAEDKYLRFTQMEPIRVLCSENFLENWNEVISQLASGRWASMYSPPNQETLLPELRETAVGRPIVCIDTNLIDFRAVDMELPGRGALLLFKLSEFEDEEQARSIVLTLAELSAIDRYRCIHVCICHDAPLTSHLLKSYIRAQSPFLGSGKNCTTISFKSATPEVLTEVVAETVLQYHPPGVLEDQRNLFSFVDNCRLQEQLRFLVSLLPLLTALGACQLLRLHRLPILLTQPRIRQQVMMAAGASPSRAREVHPLAMMQLSQCLRAYTGAKT